MNAPLRRLPTLRLAFGSVFWRVAWLTFAIREIAVWNFVRRWMPGTPRLHRIPAFLYHSPKSFYYAFLIGAIVAIAADLIVRYLLQPLVRRWLSPKVRPESDFGTAIDFHLAPREAAVAEWPARMRRGRAWTAGTMVLTDRRLAFFPIGWSAEPWFLALDELGEVGREKGTRFAFGLVRGVPDRLVIGEAKFAVAHPAAVINALGQGPFLALQG